MKAVCNSCRVDVYSRRLGGAFGLKLTRNTLAAVACSLAAFKLNRPCRVVMSFSSVARALGKRFPASCDVKVGMHFYRTALVGANCQKSLLLIIILARNRNRL